MELSQKSHVNLEDRNSLRTKQKKKKYIYALNKWQNGNTFIMTIKRRRGQLTNKKTKLIKLQTY